MQPLFLLHDGYDYENLSKVRHNMISGFRVLGSPKTQTGELPHRWEKQPRSGNEVDEKIKRQENVS